MFAYLSRDSVFYALPLLLFGLVLARNLCNRCDFFEPNSKCILQFQPTKSTNLQWWERPALSASNQQYYKATVHSSSVRNNEDTPNEIKMQRHQKVYWPIFQPKHRSLDYLIQQSVQLQQTHTGSRCNAVRSIISSRQRNDSNTIKACILFTSELIAMK